MDFVSIVGFERETELPDHSHGRSFPTANGSKINQLTCFFFSKSGNQKRPPQTIWKLGQTWKLTSQTTESIDICDLLLYWQHPGSYETLKTFKYWKLPQLSHQIKLMSVFFYEWWWMVNFNPDFIMSLLMKSHICSCFSTFSKRHRNMVLKHL